MSRQSRLLPPRCPFQKQPLSPPVHECYLQHHKSASQSSILEEQPAWLDDLLSDTDADSKGNSLRRSASDSVTLLGGLMNSISGLNSHINEENSVENESCCRLESASRYGPNSPRRIGSASFSENAIATALSEYFYQNPLQYLDDSLSISEITQTDSKGDASGSVGKLNGETNNAKRHSGQRSRVRKLQYIAELERSVNVLQTVESELAIKVASLLQKRVALSVENSKLKQQMVRLRQEKLFVEGQYKNLKKEVQKLRNSLANSSNNKVRTYSGSRPQPEASRSQVKWQMLDMENLNLN